MNKSDKSKIVVIAGPSGAGKSTLSTVLGKKISNFKRIVSHTTRAPRESDPAGEYKHCSKKELQMMHASGKLLWLIQIHTDLYATAKRSVQNAVKSTGIYTAVLEIEKAEVLYRHLETLGRAEQCVLLYLLSPGKRTLRRRLLKRGDMTPEQIERRIEDCADWDEKARQAHKERGIPFHFLETAEGKPEIVAEKMIRIIFNNTPA